MLESKHDLNAGEVKISYPELIKTAEIAVGLARTECERALNDLQTQSFKGCTANMRHAAERLQQAAENVFVAANTLHYLREGMTRDKLTVVGFPQTYEFVCPHCRAIYHSKAIMKGCPACDE